MPKEPDQRFNLLDWMILVAGVALGFWVTPEDMRLGIQTAVEVTLRSRSVPIVASWASGIVIHFGQPIAAVATLTILALSLRTRTSLRRLTSRPGFVACLAAMIAVGIGTSLNLGLRPYNFNTELPLGFWVQLSVQRALMLRGGEPGFAVLGAWLILVLSGRWRSQPVVLDGCGRILGAFWIALIPASWLCISR